VEGATRYYIRFYSTSGGKVLRLTRWINAPRNYFFDVDYQKGDYTTSEDYTYGLPTGSYEWQAATDDSGAGTVFATGTFSVPAISGPAKPALVAPVGGTRVYGARVDADWTMAYRASRVRLDVTKPAGGTESFYYTSPYGTAAGQYRTPFPFLLGSDGWPNGTYQWKMRSYVNGTWSSYSSTATFEAQPAPPPTGAPSIAGDVLYYGRTPVSEIIIEAYTSRGFSGEAVARMSLGAPGAYELLGLDHKVYFVRAFMDVNGNGTREEWEPMGVARDATYGPHYEYWVSYDNGPFDLTGAQKLSGATIVIRDRDTDNDNLPDGWEMMEFGNLTQVANDDDDGDGVPNWREYACGSNPLAADSDGDGLKDGVEYRAGYSLTVADNDEDRDGIPGPWEVNWDKNTAYNPYDPVTGIGTDLNLSTGDADGDGVSDLTEIAAGSDPLDAAEWRHVVTVRTIRKDAYGNTVVEWNTYPNDGGMPIRFDVEYSSNYRTWSVVGGYTANGTSAVPVTFTDTRQLRGGAYRLRYRVAP
jgi:hypothetical protein